MVGQKRKLDVNSSTQKSKRTKLDKASSNYELPLKSASNLVSEEVDFPRGGGTTFTPYEVKAIRAEALKEANDELFEEYKIGTKAGSAKRRKSELNAGKASTAGNSDRIRIEHLNYKRLTLGMKILGHIVSIQPLALIISLPNQLFAHVPITHISSQLTASLEAAEGNEGNEDSSEEGSEEEPARNTHVPDLSCIFRSGQYVRAIVTAVHEPGSTDMIEFGKTRDHILKASRRVELSLVPERVNAGVHKTDLRAGYTLSAAVKSVEDHGYILDLGIPDVSGFLSFKDTKKGPFDHNAKLHVGGLLDVTVTSMSSSGRTCKVAVDPETFSSASLSEVTNVASVLPGTLVQSLVTAVHSTGLNLQILGYFEGTIDQFHLGLDASADPYKLGKKLKARILYSFSSTSPRFALSLNENVLKLGVKCIPGENSSCGVSIQEAYPIGTALEDVEVLRTEPERGLVVSVQPGLEGFVHISQVSDDHVPSLPPSSGPWKLGSIHRARVTGYFPFDGLLQLSFRQSILEQKFLRVDDVKVGEMITGTVKKLTDSGLFLTLSGQIDGVVWPNHYADITLKYPARRFKVGKSIKCRVLHVDPERQRISLTAKKTLLDSTLPILWNFEDAKAGLVLHAVVFKISEKNLMVEFYNNLKATIPLREASETTTGKLSDSFSVGKVVKVRILSVNPETLRIVASIRQAGAGFQSAVTDIRGVEIGNIVEGVVSDIHKDNAILTLQPTQVRALISLKNLANHRSVSLPQLRASLNEGAKLEELVVVTRNPEKGFVIVASRPKPKVSLPTKGALSMDTVEIGQMVGGRVTGHARNGALLKLNARIGGTLHPTDASDNYETGPTFPAIDSVMKATIVGIDHAKNQLVLSTRHSRMYPDQQKPVVDREIKSVTDLKTGDTVRGFVKSVAEHGLFVTLGSKVDARVQIKELFDEYIKDWKSRFKSNQLVKGRILSIDVENNKVDMSFRSEDLSRETSASLTLSDLHEGQKVDGRVKRIEDYGLFMEINGSKLTGLCHKSELSDNKDADVVLALRSFHEGDVVKAIVLSIEVVKRRISLGLKPSYFSDEDLEEKNEDHSRAENSEAEFLGVVGVDDDMSGHGDPDALDNKSITSETEDEDESVRIDIDMPLHSYTTATTPTASVSAPLKIQGGFQWSGSGLQSDAQTDPGFSSDDTDEEEPSGKKKRRRKEIEQDLTAEMHTKTPESNADFERLLLGSPNSSYLWIQYISFQLQLSEVDKAREVGYRALQTINFREEQEKLNVWIALLNLENVYGTDETLETTFKNAARHNDSKTVHLRLASIFDQAEKHEKAEEQYKRTCKKFGQSSKVWTLFGEHYFKRGDLEQARKLLPRSLQSLEKRKHLKTISKFAQLEYRLGDPERGKTIFEGVVDSHPKRWDLWSIYMDMEAVKGDIQSLRNLFDRVLALKMTSHKAKFFFKKWLALEHKLGDEDGATIVKQKAVEWTQNASNS